MKNNVQNRNICKHHAEQIRRTRQIIRGRNRRSSIENKETITQRITDKNNNRRNKETESRMSQRNRSTRLLSHISDLMKKIVLKRLKEEVSSGLYQTNNTDLEKDT